MHPDKVEAIRQWTSDPCGAVDDMDAGNRSYWERVDRERYEIYAPWLRETMGFGDYPGKTVLEVGCGMGTDLMQFARGGSIVHGLDLTPRHLELTSRRFRAFDMPVNLVRGDAESLPFAPETFDVVYSFGVLHHTPDMKAALNEIHRVLKPGGVMLLALYNRWSLFFLYNILWEQGLRKRGLFRQNWRSFISRIERRRSHESAHPRVDLVSRRQLRRDCRSFARQRITTDHIGIEVQPLRETDGPWKKIIKRLYWANQRPIAKHLGWYLLVYARKLR